ncbi:biotin transporter BioY [Gulosibacter molinativorax]|uniref:Biotin transporter n=1 Tax=Gulosibacter molinativorax TaxID=256821 RepID=A0ABT7C7M4_9MICO|nr:biotin transporter BioY [Gulosibacter molinativorax]MDJ1371128.1 biotin transporter BioY [Gulosibacter molinativorax]QUY61488.1 Uncharacterized conserved protein [Gulosibacter molinativorax]
MNAAVTRARGLDASDLARIAIFAALIAVLGLPGAINVGAVPITAQTLGVMLAGAVLGARRGALSVIVVLALVAIGLPLLSGGRGGLGVFVAPSAGYLIGWVFGAFVIGLIVRAGANRPTWWRVALGAVVGGILVIYLFGIPVQSALTQLPLGETIIASAVFLPGDLIKAALTVVITMALWRAYPRAFAWSTSPTQASVNAAR